MQETFHIPPHDSLYISLINYFDGKYGTKHAVSIGIVPYRTGLDTHTKKKSVIKQED